MFLSVSRCPFYLLLSSSFTYNHVYIYYIYIFIYIICYFLKFDHGCHCCPCPSQAEAEPKESKESTEPSEQGWKCSKCDEPNKAQRASWPLMTDGKWWHSSWLEVREKVLLVREGRRVIEFGNMFAIFCHCLPKVGMPLQFGGSESSN